VTSGYVLHTLSWTAPGDDGNVGTAAAYDVRYSTSLITEDSWPAATQIGEEPLPAAAGTVQTLGVTGLTAGDTYHFAVKTSDEADNQSSLSNVVAGSLPAPPASLLSNGTFEGGDLNGWRTINGAPATATAQAHTGSYSALLANAEMEASVDTTPGEAYKVICWIKIVTETGSDWGGFRVHVSSWGFETLAHSPWILTSSHGSEWFKVALSFTATTSKTRIAPGYHGGPARSMSVHVDDVVVRAKDENLPPEVVVTFGPASIEGLPQTQEFSLAGDDPDGAIVRVLWDFGDGTRAFDQSGVRRVALPGAYVATVSVADDEGSVVTRTISWTAMDSAFPDLAIDVPVQPASTVDEGTLLLSGTASASTTSVRVSTDRGYSGMAIGTSNWSANVPLRPGYNRILVQAQDEEGRIVTEERSVRYVPSDSLLVSNLGGGSTSVERWEVLEVTFNVDNSAATDPQFPYDTALPPGLEWLDGITVDGLFTPDDWQTVYRRPALLNQRYERALKSNEEWLYPIGEPIWTVRFAPPEEGEWKYRIEVQEAKGSAQSAERTFMVTAPTNPENHGPVSVAENDTRYFEYADGTPFLGTGHGIGFSKSGPFNAVDRFEAMGAGNQEFLRWWLGGSVWGSAWQAWASRTLGYDGYIPPNGLTLDRVYGAGLASLKLDAENPLMFYGFWSSRAGLVPGRTYRLRVRWRTENVTGPDTDGEPYGVTVKLTGWPEPGQTGSIPALIPHVCGDTPWHVAEADLVGEGDLLPNIALILENTSTGAAYVDEVDLYEVLPGGSLGPQLLRNPRFNSHLTFDCRGGATIDAILEEAAARGKYMKLVISEKNEYLLNRLAPDGLPDPNGGHFVRGEGSPSRRLHEYYWRHLLARFGAYRCVHSWELVNEQNPRSMEFYRLAAALASQAAADGNPHLATTSTWAGLAEDYWKDPDSAPISYTDFHAYVRGTGWIEPKEELANDSARFFGEYDQVALAAGFGKPVVWGEQGIDGTEGTDGQEPLLAQDDNGVWLHKMTWARCGPGGVYPLYWYSEHIWGKSLHGIFGAWNRFMAGIPLTSGRYEDAAASTSDPDFRVFGQKDVQDGRAHLWIDNRQHTWRAVVDGTPVTPISGTVSVAMGSPNASYLVTWYDTDTGALSHSEPISADGTGVLTLTVTDLSTDVAAKIAPE